MRNITRLVIVALGPLLLLDSPAGTTDTDRTGTLQVTTVDLGGALINAPITVKRRRRTVEGGSGSLKVDLSPGRYRVFFGDLAGYSIEDPDSGASLARIKPGKTTEVKATYASTTPPLKTLAEQRGIGFGAMYQYDLRDDVYDQVFEREMSAITAGTFWTDGSRPSRTEYNLSEMDAKVRWGGDRNMELHGHILVWFDDIPDWLDATPNSEVEAVMNEHIDTVVGRYAGRIKLWDVVNEAVDDDGTLRQNHKWAEAMGTDYVSRAFVRSHAADPTAVLRYNEYDIERNRAKFEGVKALLIDLKNRDVPVHALGWQLHVTPASFNPAVLLTRMNEIADLGFDNYITELDVRLPNDASDADFERQKQTYRTIVETFLAAQRHKTIVVWGLRDGDPWWLTDNHPLLFDEALAKKPAYFGVQEALLASE